MDLPAALKLARLPVPAESVCVSERGWLIQPALYRTKILSLVTTSAAAATAATTSATTAATAATAATFGAGAGLIDV